MVVAVLTLLMCLAAAPLAHAAAATNNNDNNFGHATVLNTVPIDGGVNWASNSAYNIQGIMFYLSVSNATSLPANRSSNLFLTKYSVLMRAFNPDTAQVWYHREFECTSASNTYSNEHRMMELNRTHSVFLCNQFVSDDFGIANISLGAHFFNPITGLDYWSLSHEAPQGSTIYPFSGMFNNAANLMVLALTTWRNGAMVNWVVDTQTRSVRKLLGEVVSPIFLFPFALTDSGLVLSIRIFENDAKHLVHEVEGRRPLSSSSDNGRSRSNWTSSLPAGLGSIIGAAPWSFKGTSPRRTANNDAAAAAAPLAEFIAVLVANTTLLQTPLDDLPSPLLECRNFTLLIINVDDGTRAATVPITAIPDGALVEPGPGIDGGAWEYYDYGMPSVVQFRKPEEEEEDSKRGPNGKTSTSSSLVAVMHFVNLLYAPVRPTLTSDKVVTKNLCAVVAVNLSLATTGGAKEEDGGRFVLWSRVVTTKFAGPPTEVVGSCDWHVQPKPEPSTTTTTAATTTTTVAHHGWFVYRWMTGSNMAPFVESLDIATGKILCFVADIPPLVDSIGSGWRRAFTTHATGDLLLLQGVNGGVDPNQFVAIDQCTTRFAFDLAAGSVHEHIIGTGEPHREVGDAYTIQLNQVTRFGNTLIVPTEFGTASISGGGSSGKRWGQVSFVNVSDITPPKNNQNNNGGTEGGVDGTKVAVVVAGVVFGIGIVVALFVSYRRCGRDIDEEYEALNE